MQRRLQEALPEPQVAHGAELRHAAIGFASTAASDVSTNFLRVLTTLQQTEGSQPAEGHRGYSAQARQLIQEQGLRGLFGRGLQTRLLASGLQGAVFNVAWKGLQEHLGA